MSLAARQKLVNELIFKPGEEIGKADLLDPSLTSTNLIAYLLDILDYGHIIEVTMVRTGHHDDGPHGHAGGFAIDCWPLNTRTEGDWMDPDSEHFRDFLEDAGKSPWRYQVGLAGTAQKPENFRAAGDSAFADDGADHIHLGAEW
jgi:hypothetical protein